MKARFELIEGWARFQRARPLTWLVYGLYLGAGKLVAAASACWSWLRRWRHLPEGGIVATVVKDGDKN
jgi:hypothetical protein